ncbi:MAG: hypothetical protein AAF138_08485 [Planctomycetota bacterium]
MYAFTFLGSLGTGLVTNGVYFLAKSALGYAETANYLLALVFGVAYIAGAVTVGPALRSVARRSDRVTSRLVLALLLILLAGVCAVPIAAQRITGAPQAWTLWLLAAVYAPLTGALWPIVEAYLSGGRRGRELRHAVGGFNIVWAGAVAASLWLAAPLVEPQPLLVLALLGLLHVLSLALLPALGREPGRHLSDEPHEVNPIDRSLLRVFRILLPASYLVSSTLQPFLPSGLAKLGVSVTWAAPAAATWMSSRLIVFAVMQRWHGWRHAPALPTIGALMLLAGFGLAVVAPSLGGTLPQPVPLTLMLAGLAAFGAGMAVIYCAALYYAMEVGAAEVDAGGAHEALIGVGYAAGPLAGLACLAATEPIKNHISSAVTFESLLAAGVTAATLLAVFIALRLAKSHPIRQAPSNRY